MSLEIILIVHALLLFW